MEVIETNAITVIPENPLDIPDFTRDVYGQKFHYLGNTKLKGKNAILPFSDVHIQELYKCQQDIYYFAKRYYKIVHADKGLITINLRRYQERLLNNFLNNRFTINVASRQCGKCCLGDSVIKIKTYEGEIMDIKIGDFYDLLNRVYQIDQKHTKKPFYIINKSMNNLRRLIIWNLKKFVRNVIKP